VVKTAKSSLNRDKGKKVGTEVLEKMGRGKAAWRMKSGKHVFFSSLLSPLSVVPFFRFLLVFLDQF
jgi:hypothetical protein